jgi:hypothetical protein
LEGDAVRHVCAWRGAAGLQRMGGDQVRVRLTLRHAQLFSLST